MSYQKHDFRAGSVLLASQLNEMDNEIELLGNKESGFPESFKTALLNCFNNVAWTNENGQFYYNSLYASLYPESNIISIDAVFDSHGETIYTTNTLNSLRQYLTVTALYEGGITAIITDYTLSGELVEGTSTITVEYSTVTTTFDVVVSSVAGLFTISNMLTDCFNTNDSTTITENDSYEANIIANQGFVLNDATVSITMGGANITEMAYLNGSINIPNVTGNLVITASAVSAVSSISAVFSTGVDTPKDISSASVISAWISNTTNVWATDSSSTSICIPVTVGKQYSLSFSTTDSSVVGTIFKWGFTNSNSPTGQVIRNVGRSTPQNTQTAITEVANASYLIIQLSSSYINSILSNGYLTVTELAGRVYTHNTLESLRQYLTVTATYVDTSTAVVTDYELSGTLSEGTSTITVTYGGQTDIFTVNCLIQGYLYRFNQSLLSSGSKDFGLTGVENYDTGLFNRYCYSHCPVDSANDPLGLKALNVVEYPDVGTDFTLSCWIKQNNYTNVIQFNPIFATIYTGSGNPSNKYIGSATKESNWTISRDSYSGKGLSGFAIQGYQDAFIFRIMNGANNASSQLSATAPSAFDPQQWHHYAVTRKGTQIRMFVDGVLLTIASTSQTTGYQANQVAIASYFIQTSADKSNLQAQGFGQYIQDLYISNFCKWDSSFDPQTITY